VAPLTRVRIVDTAVTMADRDGFEAVTLRRIAAELGVHVTSLYNHLPTREAVTDGMVERLLEEADLPRAGVGWEDWVRRFFSAMGALAERHPGAFTALQRRPVQGANAAATFEVALAAFARAGLGPADAYSAVKATTLTALAVGEERSLRSSGQLLETSLEDLPEAEFPNVRRLVVADQPEAAWDFTLEVLISGLRSNMRRLRAAGRSGTP
jgi:AcrR family transcriptional regulator